MASVDETSKELADALARIRELEAEIDVARVNAHDSENQIRNARDAFTKLEAERGIARQKADESAARIASARENFNRLEKQLKESEEGIFSLKAQLFAAAQERQRLISVSEDLRQRVRARKGLLDRLWRPGFRTPLPQSIQRARDRVSRRVLRGNGIEIGALHSPITVSRGVEVRYVDRMSRDSLREAYPEHADYDFVQVDVIDDGETLANFESESLDFVVASHMLEHCENPIGTFRHQLEKLRANGILFYIVPDRRGSFDADRPLTSFEHLERDDRDGPAVSRSGHYREYAELVSGHGGKEIEMAARLMEADNISIHFHVWEDSNFREFLDRSSAYLGISFTVDHFELNGSEILAVIRKQPSS